ncbi:MULTISPECIES: hypothetical protein [Pseudomonas]|jgi:hypothetical protein|uniref:Uncharacterized protein n=2 Tax=Pseudomonas TaxID=286 RepID=A0A5E7UZY0_PSEFL|nr:MULTISPECIES: hypothetical protein [Pseudomonas]OOQ45978.1 hypothetical protein AO361_23425 [Pseudomonas fluorescens]OXR36892.1 hypothetical protein PSJE_16295 [Pseudomonas jessenii]QHF37876.1 hypothetical protein PspS34_06215 [Pseudomonas sp. S34]SEB87155.1 hypothetical protein SAMN04490187_2288 [Pseudomonas jessenii]VVM51344.1 hypothetical protein PS673_00780 [Pseudomonas fluorescens]
MNNNGPINVPRIIARTEYEPDDSSIFSASASKFPNQYTIMTINISNNTDGPIRLLKAGWDLTGTSLSAFEIEANDEQTLDLPYLRDFSSNGMYYNKRKFAPILQQFSYITEDGLIFTLAIQLTVSVVFGVLHPNLKPNWSKTITRSGNSNSSYKVTADITKKNKEAPFSFSVDLIVG